MSCAHSHVRSNRHGVQSLVIMLQKGESGKTQLTEIKFPNGDGDAETKLKAEDIHQIGKQYKNRGK